MNPDIVKPYRYFRSRGLRACDAVLEARPNAGTDYTIPKPFAPAGAPFQNGLRWVEQAPRNGFRFVGYADEIVSSIRHQGWFVNEFQDETARGAVYQLTGVESGARYVAGMADPCGNDGAAVIDFSRVFLGDPVDCFQSVTHDSGARDAALAADGIAERYADCEKAWNEAANARFRHDEAKDEIRALVIERRALLVGALASGMMGKADALAAIGERQESIRERVTKLYKKRAELRLAFDHLAAWKEGA